MRSRSIPTPRGLLAALVLALALVVAFAGTTASAHRAAPSGGVDGLDKTPCVYSGDSLSQLDVFSRLVGRQIDCAMVYSDVAENWAQWVDPWYLNQVYADEDFRRWASEPGAHHRLIVTQNLFPASVDDRPWLTRGAAGDYRRYARALARNLVAAGLGSVVIRLAHEANGTWYPDSVPGTARGDRLWIRFWRRTALAMRSVRGAHFLFDWTVNAGVRAIPLSSFYPGDDVVDIVGVDAYDDGVAVAGRARWDAVARLPDGLDAVARFAAAHGKPLSIPEWGIGPRQDTGRRWGGDDPAYVRGIASIVAHDDVAYQSYFDYEEEGVQLANSPASVAAYRQAFGAWGGALTAAQRGPQQMVAAGAPALRIGGGPMNGATVRAASVTFTFAAAPDASLWCAHDTAAWTPCTSASDDVMRDLAPGFHLWRIKALDTLHRTTLLGRAFTVS